MKIFFSIFIIISIILASIAFARKKKKTKVVGAILLLLPICLTCVSDYNLVLPLALGLALGFGSVFLLNLIKSRNERIALKLTYSVGFVFIINILLAGCLVYFAITKQINLLLIFALILPIFALILAALIRKAKATGAHSRQREDGVKPMN